MYDNMPNKIAYNVILSDDGLLTITIYSTLTEIKNKYQTKLNVELDFRVAVSNMQPHMKTIISKIQVQVFY